MSNSKNRDISRRRFLSEAPCAALGSATLFSSLLSLKMTNAAAAANAPSVSSDDDYKALVCVFMQGGNDSYNMLVPRNQTAYNAYAANRANLKLDLFQEDGETPNILPITSDGQAYEEFGLHPRTKRMQTLYNEQNLAFVANIGSLVEPIETMAQYRNKSKLLPKGLFSHSDQQNHWQTCIPQVRGTTLGGWGGRASELLRSLNDESLVSMNVSVSGLNTFQTSENSFAFVTGYDGAAEMVAYQDPFEKAAVDSLLTENYKNLYQKTFGKNSKRFIESSLAFNEAFENNTLSPDYFSTNNTGRKFKAVARTIAAQSALKMKRQTFFIQIGGWDHHTDLLNRQNTLLSEVSEGLYAFYRTLENLGQADNVVTFSISDFGRTLSSNDAGSDHGWGGNAFVMGGPVQGGKIYGAYPDLAKGAARDTGRGRQIPTTSADQYSAELAKWFGVANGDLETVFPNIRNFYDPYSITPPIGFINSSV